MAASAEPLPGPIPAELVSVIDGDTVAVRARIWPGKFVETRVRLAGVDTPERRGADCARERALAEAATVFTAGLAKPRRRPFALHDVETGSFAGRVIARILARRRRQPGRGVDRGRAGGGLWRAGAVVQHGTARPPSPR
jgi:micrococcal nuclease